MAKFMKINKKTSSFLSIIFLVISMMCMGLMSSSCSTHESKSHDQKMSHHFNGHPHKIVGEPFYSSRDYVTINHQSTQWQFVENDLLLSTRDPANDCFSAISNFLFGSKVPKPEVNKDTLPLLS